MKHKTDMTAVIIVIIVVVVMVLLLKAPRQQNGSNFDLYKRPILPVSKDNPQKPEFPTGINKGYVPNPSGTQRFLRQLPNPLIRDAAPNIFGVKEDDKPVLLYRALYKAYEQYSHGSKWVVGRQGIGDCVGWGYAHGADVELAVMWALGDSAEWYSASSEAVYGGSRCEAQGKDFAGYSDGSYGAAGAKWLMEWGVIFRQKYDTANLIEYSAERAKDWGAYGCGGKDDKGVLDFIAKKHPIKEVALVQSFEEAAPAIKNGYPVVVCSMQGFAMNENGRDKDGFGRPEGQWAHCMVFIAVRYDRPGLLCLNSWGPDWIKGPKWPEDMPDGSFWVDAKTCTSMLSGRDSFALSGYEGFPARKLDHGDWVQNEKPRMGNAVDYYFASRN